MVRLEELGKLKNLMISSGIETEALRSIKNYLNLGLVHPVALVL
jgi:hypothetical protein